MMVAILLTGTLASILLGRTLFGRWFNHVSLYAALWGFSLTLYEVRLIEYYRIQPETWMIIVSGWLAFLGGCLAVIAARMALGLSARAGNQDAPPGAAELERELRLMKLALVGTTIVALLVGLQHWSVVIRKFGNVQSVLLWGNLLYSFRVQEGLPGSIPYLTSLALTGMMFAGMYTAAKGRITILAVISFLTVVLIELAHMGRAKLVMAAMLFLSGYFFYKERAGAAIGRARREGGRRALSLALAFVLLLASAEFVRSTRGGTETFHGASRVLRGLEGASFITPSLYMYATIHPGILNQYLKEDVEHLPCGSNTFAPVYRILAKLGFDTKVNTYQRFYKTPAFANTGTYLRELHADFGIAGVLMGPFALGLLATVFWFKVRERFQFAHAAVAMYLFVLVAMSLLYGATRAGDLLTAFLAGLLISMRIDAIRTRAVHNA